VAVASFQINLREWKLDPALPTASVKVAMRWSDGFFIWFAGHVARQHIDKSALQNIP